MDITDVDNLLGQTLVGDDGEKIGRIEDVYLDADSRTPEWALVHTGLFGRRESFVPLGDATVVTGGVHVPYTKARVKDAPSAEPDGNLSAQEEDELYRHYGMTDTFEQDAPVVEDSPVTHATTTDDRPSMVRSEEKVNVTMQRRPSRTVRLRKKVVVENVTTTVPVRREVLEVIEDDEAPEPDDIVRAVGEHEAVRSGDGDRDDVQEIILHEERPVVTLETVATERVRVGRESDVEQTTITQPVQKERVYVEETPLGEERDS